MQSLVVDMESSPLAACSNDYRIHRDGSRVQEAAALDQEQWPEPVQRVQLLAESGISTIPPQYIRPLSQRPIPRPTPHSHLIPHPSSNTDPDPDSTHDLSPDFPRNLDRTPIASSSSTRAQKPKLNLTRKHDANPSSNHVPSPLGRSPTSHNIPIIDLSELRQHVDDGADSIRRRDAFLCKIRNACQAWGFFQVINHGVPISLLHKMSTLSRRFFHLPMCEKQVYSNNPKSYEGYGSRIGIRKGAVLDWGDYYFLKAFPSCDRDQSKWPSSPPHWRDTMEEYSEKMVEVAKEILGAISLSLGLENEREIEQKLGQEMDVGLRVNFYPPCPQPDLTLGLSSHSDPGAITLLLPDDQQVAGLQIRSPVSTNEYYTQDQAQDDWITVRPQPDALIVNLGDQLQILTNGLYKSIEHRVVVNNKHERLSVACFISPANDTVVAPLPELLQSGGHHGGATEPAYIPMTFRDYRSFIRRSGTNGKGHLNFVASPTPSPQPASPSL